ncbi:uncharacterized protein LOC111888835 isoform X2 [Lactuca sativa]|uniref:uncharacterized protein LOC111888835 isoform X2 n=1 Tax=Lactuca sativa TaxID=4236 RepID=UPI000CD7F401|nr:uncharacterized protein LOC111888835 isoform X2 [Lactuca sativa]
MLFPGVQAAPPATIRFLDELLHRRRTFLHYNHRNTTTVSSVSDELLHQRRDSSIFQLLYNHRSTATVLSVFDDDHHLSSTTISSTTTGGMMSLLVKLKTEDSVKRGVIDGVDIKSRRHLNVRGKSATLPSIIEKDWDDIKFGVSNQVDFYAVSFVKDAEVIHELKNYLKTNETNNPTYHAIS